MCVARRVFLFQGRRFQRLDWQQRTGRRVARRRYAGEKIEVVQVHSCFVHDGHAFGRGQAKNIHDAAAVRVGKKLNMLGKYDWNILLTRVGGCESVCVLIFVAWLAFLLQTKMKHDVPAKCDVVPIQRPSFPSCPIY